MLQLFFCQLVILAAQRYVRDHVTINDDGCWIATTSGDGRYRHFWFLGRRYKAHVLSWLAFCGPIARNQVIDHERCDNTQCCNPDHLRACTQSANMKRCFAAGRGRSTFITTGDSNG